VLFRILRSTIFPSRIIFCRQKSCSAFDGGQQRRVLLGPELNHKNHIVLHGMVVSDITPYKNGYLFTLNTDEDVRGARFSSDHYVFVADEVGKKMLDTKIDDLVLVEGLASGDKFIFATDIVNATHAFKRKQQVAPIRHRNHLTIHATVTKEHHRVRNGFVLFAQTDIKVAGAAISTVHEILAGDHLAQRIQETKPGDFLIVEGPVSRDRQVVVVHFTNLTSAFRGRRKTVSS